MTRCSITANLSRIAMILLYGCPVTPVSARERADLRVMTGLQRMREERGVFSGGYVSLGLSC